MYGIHINGKGNTFNPDIMAHLKLEETRARRTLDRYIPDRVGLIETGNGPAVLYGFATIGEPTTYSSVEQFRAAYDVHRVAEGSAYDIKIGCKKYGYPITDLVLLDTPVVLPSWTFTGNRTARNLPEEFSEKRLTLCQ